MLTNRLIAHRGWQRWYPENTLLAIEKAISVGALHIEIDIQQTIDGHIVLAHDDNLQRLTGSSSQLTRSTLEQLKTLSAHEPERLGSDFVGTRFATLQECLSVINANPEVTLYIEIKEESINAFGHSKVLEGLLRDLTPFSEQTKLISFDYAILTMAKQQSTLKVIPVLKHFDDFWHQEVIDLQPEMVFCNYQFLLEADISSLPYRVACYEIGDEQAAHKWLNKGVAMVETFDIGGIISPKASSPIDGTHPHPGNRNKQQP